MNKKLMAILLTSTMLSAGVVMAKPHKADLDNKVEAVEMERKEVSYKEHHRRMAEKMADDLDLSKEQREEAAKIRQEGRDKIKPLMDEMKDIREKIDAERRANMEEFEKILTPEQQEKFDKMKKRGAEEFRKKHKERKDRWEDRKDKKDKKDKYKEKKGKHRKDGRKGPEGVEDEVLPPPPPPADDEAPIPPMPLLEDEGVLPPPPEAE